jgi:outer membrane receptor for ferric coprogen and ferric-rhodotorulic acid
MGSPTNGNSINSPFNDLKEIEDILVANNLIPSTPLVGVFTTADRTGEGEELTIIGNPTSNWTFRLTASRLVNRQRNLAPEVRAYYAEHMPQYEAFAAQYPTLADSTKTLGGRIDEAKAAMALMNTREGVQVFPSSEYTVRFIPKYTFDRSSRLKGLSLGGNVRWTSAPIIGYYRVASNGSFDSSRAHRGDEQLLTDLFLSYQRRLTKDIDWRLQINVSNVFDKTDPYPVAAVNNVDAADFQWVAYRNRPIDGRVFYLTNTFSF